MTKTIKIEGMSCDSCKAKISKALSNYAQNVEVSFENSEAVVSLKPDVLESDLKEAVENLGYKVLSIK